MFHSDPADWPIAAPAFEGEARRIGSILNAMPEVAALLRQPRGSARGARSDAR